jgi:Fe-S-cluster containining protein
MNVSPPINSADLCIPCGLCCDGSLFERAALRLQEETMARTLGLLVLKPEKEKTFFSQPCPAFRDHKCSVHEQKPTVCKKFRCKLLVSYESSLTEKEAGLQIIKRARAMQAELLGLLPSPVAASLSLAEVKRQMRSLAQAGPQERRAHINFLLLAGKYEIFLRRYFLLQSRKEKTSQETPVMG